MNLYEIQRKLAVLGYYSVTVIDGMYGKKTQAAIDDFKDAYNISDEEIDEKLTDIILSMQPKNSATFTDKLIDIALAMNATLQQVAYILATIKHETKGSFHPVEEAYWLSESSRNAYLSKKPYGVKWAGRGYVQITWERNYILYEKLLNIPFTIEPELMLDPDISLFVTVHGMITGAFTGKKLSDYINEYKCDYVGARKIVNGTDDDELIADYAIVYENVLRKGGRF